MAREKIPLTDEQWKKIKPFLPEPEPGRRGGRPRAPNRPVVQGILWVLWTGAPLEGAAGQMSQPLDLLATIARLGRKRHLDSYLASLHLEEVLKQVLVQVRTDSSTRVERGRKKQAKAWK